MPPLSNVVIPSQTLRSDQYGTTVCSLEERLKSLEGEKANLQGAVEDADQQLRIEQTKACRQAKILAILKEDLREQREKLRQLERTNSKLQVENFQVKFKLESLHNMQTVQEELHAMKARMALMGDQLMAKLKALDEKLDAIQNMKGSHDMKLGV